MEVDCGSCPICGGALCIGEYALKTIDGVKNCDENLCDSGVSSGDIGEVIDCPRCDTPHHKECWDYNDGCAVYGCKAAMVAVVESGSDLIIQHSEVLSDFDGKADQIPSVYDDTGSQVSLINTVKEHGLKMIYHLSLLQEVHWYTVGISLTVSSLLLLSKFMYPLGNNRIVRTIAFHCLLIGFFITILARVLPDFLRHFDKKKTTYALKMPSEYTPKEIDALISDSTKNINTLEYAGCLHMAQFNFDRARDIFQRAIELDSDHQNCQFQLGRCFEKLGKYEIALATFEQAWKINKLSGVGEKSRWWADLVMKKMSAHGGNELQVQES